MCFEITFIHERSRMSSLCISWIINIDIRIDFRKTIWSHIKTTLCCDLFIWVSWDNIIKLTLWQLDMHSLDNLSFATRWKNVAENKSLRHNIMCRTIENMIWCIYLTSYFLAQVHWNVNKFLSWKESNYDMIYKYNEMRCCFE